MTIKIRSALFVLLCFTLPGCFLTPSWGFRNTSQKKAPTKATIKASKTVSTASTDCNTKAAIRGGKDIYVHLNSGELLEAVGPVKSETKQVIKGK